MTCYTRSGVLTRSTLCFAKRFNATIKISLSDPLPLGPALLWIDVRWTPAAPDGEVELVLRRLSATSADVRFFAADGATAHKLKGDVTGDQGLRRIVGVTPSAGAQPDLMLDVKVDGDLAGEPIPLLVRRDDGVTGDNGLAALRSEVAVAVQAARPADAAERAIWDRYNDLFVQGRGLAAALGALALPAASIPQIGGADTPRTLARDEVVAALQSNDDRSGTAAERAKGKTAAFDPFQGKWRGRLRVHNGCAPSAVCQDDERRAVAPVAEGSPIYLQPALLEADSRAYVQPPVDCQALPTGRDVDTPAVFAINIATGVIAGALGANAQAVEGIRARRPQIGFYLAEGRLLWLREDTRSAAASTYSLFEELATVGNDGVPLYTITGFTLTWDRTQRRITSPLTPFGGQVRQVLTPEEAALARDFQDRRLRPAHLQEMRYRRLLESLDPATAQQFFDNADDATRDYLTRLLKFVHEQAALAAAPQGDRTSITFIMGEDPPAADDDHRFYTGATAHFMLHPAGRLVTHLRTLLEVRNYLDANRPDNGLPWGEVNIVVHANEEGGMTIPVADVPAGQNPAFHYANVHTLPQAIANGTLQPLVDAVVDVRTTIHIRGCSLGQSQTMLHLLSTGLGGDEAQRPMVRAPKHLQAFEFSPRGWRTHHVNPPTGSDLYFVEFWFVGFPSDHRPNNAALIQQFNAKYPGAGINWAQGLAHPGAPAGDQLTNETRDRTYRFEQTTGYFPLPANNAALANTLAQIGGDFAGLSNVQETNREPADEGRTRVFFDAIQNGNPFNGHLDMGPNPPANDAARRVLVSADPDVVADLARVGHVFADYDWGFVQNDKSTGNGGREWNLVATGRHTILRIQRELREPDPARPGRTRRLYPAVTDLAHFGEEVPARPAQRPPGENVPIENPNPP